MSRLRVLAEVTWVETKLFWREPVSVVFTLALPLLILVVLGGVFGDTPDPDGAYYRGVGAMTFYTPAYVGLVLGSIGLVGLPAHLAGYRERGVLRRFRASAVPASALLGAQVAVTVAVALAASVLVVVLGLAGYGADPAVSWPGVAVAFVAGALCFAAIGVLLGTLLPTARAALGAGVLLWFVTLFLAGGGPPPEALGTGLRLVGQATPAFYVIRALQDPWIGRGANAGALAVVVLATVTCWVLAVRLLRRD